jgi:hypothetical protein
VLTGLVPAIHVFAPRLIGWIRGTKHAQDDW